LLPALREPQDHPPLLVTAGEVRLCGISIMTLVVTAADANDPTLPTITEIVPGEPVVHGPAVTDTFRSGPLTIWTSAEAESSTGSTSLELLTEASMLAEDAEGLAATVPLMVIAGKLRPVASELVSVQVSTDPAVAAPHAHPPPLALGLPRSPGILTVTVVPPDTVAVPEFVTVTVMFAACPASQTGVADNAIERSAPLIMTTSTVAESLSESVSPELLTVAVNRASWLVEPAAEPVTPSEMFG
jgi:hypothetical protein